MTDQYMEYVKLHIISLEQDLEANPDSENVLDIPAQIATATHLLTVYGDMLYNGNLREEQHGLTRTSTT